MQKSGKSISVEMSKLPEKRHYHFKGFYLQEQQRRGLGGSSSRHKL